MGLVKSEAIEFGTAPIPVAALGTGTPSGSNFLRGDGTWATPAGGVSDGDKGDITVTASGATWTIDAQAVTLAKVVNIAANSFLANVTGSPATVQEVATSRIPLFASAITGTPNSGTFLRGDGSWAAPTASVSINTASIAFTDGDTARRVTISNGAVTASSNILCSVQRPTVTEANDRGYCYTATVVSRGTGTFDVLIIALDTSGLDPSDNPPNETVTLLYLIG